MNTPINKQKIILVTLACILLGLVLSLVLIPRKTPEQIQAREEAKIERMRVEAEIEAEKQRIYNERLRIEAEAQAAKPPEVQAAEIQAEAIRSQTTTGDAILGTAGIAAGAYIFSQLLK